ncbi:putative methyltransferase C9orf114 homolog [Octopus sinensis]|uniref:Methyltransferase C9orf114 homolog n=1 Tax=Octopus sinensis TaxID=2607531 RepID=A0A7E6EPA6_9MOLL|nr:putative methyltransferase C9orf114 homolog [Octopus sinensis]
MIPSYDDCTLLNLFIISSVCISDAVLKINIIKPEFILKGSCLPVAPVAASMNSSSSAKINSKTKRKRSRENIKQSEPYINMRKLQEAMKQKREENEPKEKELLEKMKTQEKTTKKATESEELNTNTKNKEKNDGKGRSYTLTIALPGSILDNAQAAVLRTYLVGQVARAAVIFNVDEIVVFDERKHSDRNASGGFKADSNHLFGRLLQYLECPQYIRKQLFPRHSDLQYAGVLNPVASPHHMSVGEESIYREGVVHSESSEPGRGSLVDVGLKKKVLVDQTIPSGQRVTVKLNTVRSKTNILKGTAVSFSTPRTEAGIYWGYTVRMADSLSSVITECPYEEGYDTIIGTSDKGTSVDELKLEKFRHALVVFGGLQGLEASLEADAKLTVDNPRYLFHYYLNTCPNQGSRTIRTEEAILITMSALRPKIDLAQR